MKMLIKDLQTGIIRPYGTNQHDALHISDDGKTLSYENLQNSDGSRYGDYRFVMDDGDIPADSKIPDAWYGMSYFNIGGWEESDTECHT